jgi:iron complex transport system substrate-binding protein
MDKKLQIVWIAALIFTFLLTACGNGAGNSVANGERQATGTASGNETANKGKAEKDAAKSFQPQTLVDATGAELRFEKQVDKVVCIVSLCIDILAELGMEPSAIAESGVRTIATQSEFYGEKGKSFASIGGSFFEPNLEDIVTASPDLVIGLMGAHDALRDGLNGVAPLYLANPKSYADSIEILREIGALTGRSEEATAAAERFIEKLEQAKADTPNDKKSLIMYGSDVNFAIVTDSGLGGTVLKEISAYPWKVGDPAEDPYGEGSIPYSLEKLLEEDPDAIFVESYSYSPGTKPLSEQLAELPLWSKLKAVREKKVVEVRSPIWGDGRGTRSLGIMLDEAMAFLYPEHS